ncbi:hypothetical protein EMQ_1465 [Acetobacter aceti NBRC 14818]|uniref:Transposase n=1 Tax=Acetobacter aceti NBRC 14818 TaxID=887700 RepID=A0AB33IIZ4_ACEAC|nr:hypothetical protein EMQ_1465 [Acetobacter aceti NBRC 14818]
MLYVHLAVRLNALKGDRLHFTIFIEINMQPPCAATHLAKTGHDERAIRICLVDDVAVSR